MNTILHTRLASVMLWTFLLTAWWPGVSLGEVLLITPQQQQRLGLQFAPIRSAEPVRIKRYSAEVIVPEKQKRLITSPMAGLVDGVFVNVGDRVKKGQAIAHVISPSLLTLQREYLQARTRKALADKALARDAELSKEGIIPERRFHETQSQQQEAAALLAQYSQSLRLSGLSAANLEQLSESRGMQSGLTLVAPIQGVVLDQMVTVGQRIDEATALAYVANLSALWVEIYVPIEAAASVRLGARVTVFSQSAGSLEADVVSVVRQLNKVNQVIQVRAALRTTPEQIVPGERLAVQLASEANTVARGSQTEWLSWQVPSSSVARSGAKAQVFKAVAKGVQPVDVEVLTDEGGVVTLRGALNSQDQVVTRGVVAIKGMLNGMGGE